MGLVRHVSVALTPKGPMAFLEFWSGSYRMSFEPKIFIFLGLILFFEIYSGMYNFPKLFVDLEI